MPAVDAARLAVAAAACAVTGFGPQESYPDPPLLYATARTVRASSIRVGLPARFMFNAHAHCSEEAARVKRSSAAAACQPSCTKVSLHPPRSPVAGPSRASSGRRAGPAAGRRRRPPGRPPRRRRRSRRSAPRVAVAGALESRSTRAPPMRRPSTSTRLTQRGSDGRRMRSECSSRRRGGPGPLVSRYGIAPAAQACGRHATGRAPASRTGAREAGEQLGQPVVVGVRGGLDQRLEDRHEVVVVAVVAQPAAHSALSCGQTVPRW